MDFAKEEKRKKKYLQQFPTLSANGKVAMATINKILPYLLQVWLLITMVINTAALSARYHRDKSVGRDICFPQKRAGGNCSQGRVGRSWGQG